MNLRKYLTGIEVNQSKLSEGDLRSIEADIGFKLPDGYKSFLREVDGCEGAFCGKTYTILWKGENLKRFNAEYQVVEYLRGMLLFGSDGGGEAFAFDSEDEMAIVRVPFVGMARSLCIPIARTFEEFVVALCEKGIYAT